jgi:hypothetical protein
MSHNNPCIADPVLMKETDDPFQDGHSSQEKQRLKILNAGRKTG